MSFPDYPDDWLQALSSPWWEKTTGPIRRGRLLKAYVPHVNQVPLTMIPTERSDPKRHDRFEGTISELRVNASRRSIQAPVAGLPLHKGEVRTIYRAKFRPVIVLNDFGKKIPKTFEAGSGWFVSPTLLVAPYYGADQDGTRGGLSDEAKKRVRCCEYPQMMLEMLPIGGTTTSVLRFDHILPIGDSPASYQATEFTLTPNGLEVLDQWFLWATTGSLIKDGTLETFKDMIETL